jgi:hypothetical protein
MVEKVEQELAGGGEHVVVTGTTASHEIFGGGGGKRWPTSWVPLRPGPAGLQRRAPIAGTPRW